MIWRSGVDELSGAPMEADVPIGVWRGAVNGETVMLENVQWRPTNTSGIHPTEYKVLVKAKEIAAKTAGGIILPDEKKERDQFAQMEGVLVAVSPLAFTYEANWPDGAERPKVGDAVYFAKYAGATVKGKDGEDYRLINDRDIAAVLV